MESREGRLAMKYSPKHLKLFTENFSENNFLGNTQCGKLYRGKIPSPSNSNQTEDKEVTVKIWVPHKDVLVEPFDDFKTLKKEVYFLGHPSMSHHPNLLKMIGCCYTAEPYGVVYDLNPVDTLHNLIVKDCFNWVQRVKVALGFARFLEFLHGHESPYMVRNLDAAHILIDQDFNPILSDFTMLTGGIVGDTIDHELNVICGISGYMDPHLSAMGNWTVCRDVYHYGVILLSIIAKRVVDKENPNPRLWVDSWARKKYTGKKCSLVHKSIQDKATYKSGDGREITKLGMSCVDFSVRKRPTMKDIVMALQNLHVTRSCGDEIGL